MPDDEKEKTLVEEIEPDVLKAEDLVNKAKDAVKMLQEIGETPGQELADLETQEKRLKDLRKSVDRRKN